MRLNGVGRSCDVARCPKIDWVCVNEGLCAARVSVELFSSPIRNVRYTSIFRFPKRVTVVAGNHDFPALAYMLLSLARTPSQRCLPSGWYLAVATNLNWRPIQCALSQQTRLVHPCSWPLKGVETNHNMATRVDGSCIYPGRVIHNRFHHPGTNGRA